MRPHKDRQEVLTPPPNPHRYRRLQGLATLVMLGIVGLGAWVLYDTRQDAWDRAELASSNLVRALDSDISRTIQAYDLSLQGVITALQLPGIQEVSSDIRQMALFDRSAGATYLGSLLVLGADGRPVAASGFDTPPALDLSDRDYFQVHLNNPDTGLFISRPFRSRLRSGDPSVALSRRLVDRQGRFAGAVVGTLRLSYFQDRFSRINLGPGGSVTLYRRDGRLLARHPYRAEDIDRDLSGAETVRRYMTEAAGSFTGISVLDGEERLYTFRQVADLPLVVSVAEAVEDVFGEWRTKAVVIGTILLALVGAVLALWILLDREMARRSDAENKLVVVANTDMLTGLANRRFFEEMLLREWARAQREGTPLSLLLLDVDHFKAFNDHYGHPAGDECLRVVAAALGSALRRPADFTARYGGEEFAVLLPNTEADGARHVAEGIRLAIVKRAVPHEVSSTADVVTVSIGAATAFPDPEHSSKPLTLVEASDKALYAAKRAGRNRVVSA